MKVIKPSRSDTYIQSRYAGKYKCRVCLGVFEVETAKDVELVDFKWDNISGLSDPTKFYYEGNCPCCGRRSFIVAL